MRTIIKNAAAGTMLGGSLLFTAGVGLAQAQPTDTPDGLVNLAVGDVTILEAVNTDTAATAAGAICGSQAPDVTALVERVDVEGTQQTVCEGLPGGALAIQNTAPASEAPAVETVPEAAQGTDSVEGAQAPAEGTSSATETAEAG